MLKCLFGICTRELLDTATKKQRLHMNICPEEAPPKEKRVSTPPMSRGLFGFSFHNADTQRHERKQTSHWLLIDPSETKKKNSCYWGWLCLTCPAVTAFNHTRPAFHQEQIQLCEKQQTGKTRQTIGPRTVEGRGGRVCRLKVSQCLLYPVCLCPGCCSLKDSWSSKSRMLSSGDW